MLKKIALVAVLTAVAVIQLSAAPFVSHNSRRVPKTLIVVGNYKTPRLMAATIKGLTSQPYVIVTRDGRYFLVMRKATVPVPAADFGFRINKLDPKRVVIIGDERYVSRQQEEFLRKQLNIKRIPIVRIYGGDWGRIAEELDDMLNIGNLAREFRRNYFTVAMSDSRWSGGEVKKADKKEEVPAPLANNESAEQNDDVPASEPEVLGDEK